MRCFGAFCCLVARHSGNTRVARYIHDLGANRDETWDEMERFISGELIWLRTRNAAKHIIFLLGLPYRVSDKLIIK